MTKPRSEVLADSRKKAVAAGATTAAAIAGGVLIGPVTAAVVGVPAAVLAYRWWKHRSVNGIKF